MGGWSRFRHEFFVRGRPDLLRKIRKGNQINSADQADVDKLTVEVTYLRNELAKMAVVVQQMSGMLCQMSAHSGHGSSVEPLTKKRKIEADHVGSMLVQPPVLPDLNNETPHDVYPLKSTTMSDTDLFLEEMSSSDFMPNMEKCTSADFVDSMLDFDDYNDAYHDTVPLLINSSEDIQPCAVNSSSFVNRSVSTSEGSSVTHDEERHEEIDPALSQKLNDAISTLPKSLQNTFVERIVENIANPDAYKKHMEAVSVLATVAAIEAQNKVSEQGDDNNSSTENQSHTTLPVAAAALGAYLAKYEEATSKGCPA